MTKIAPVHPGEILREEFMIPLNLSANALARRLGVPANRISRLVAETSSITTDTAMRLAKAFGTTPSFWMNCQSAFALELAKDSRDLIDAINMIEPIETAA